MVSKKVSSVKKDAIALLMDDHKRVKGLFAEFKKFEDSDKVGFDDLKQELMDAACGELKIHAQVEEELFYPRVRVALPDEDALMNEADVEHAGATELIAQIENGNATDPMTCARFTVLGEYIDHHVKEEENEMFVKVLKADIDLVKLGRQMTLRKQELKAEMGLTFYDEAKELTKSGVDKIESLWDRVKSAVGTDTAMAHIPRRRTRDKRASANK